MPPVERTDFHDAVIVWEYVSTTRQGETRTKPPILLPCRWEEIQAERPNREGVLLVVDATFASIRLLADESICWRVPPPCVWWRTTVDKILAPFPHQLPPTRLYQIIMRDWAEELKARVTRYEYGVRRYKNTTKVS
jgi:hypothetical protein